jgi:hypothetical protein
LNDKTDLMTIVAGRPFSRFARENAKTQVVGFATNAAKISAESRVALRAALRAALRVPLRVPLRAQCETKKNGEINRRLHMMELNFECHKRSIAERKAKQKIQGLDSNRLEPIDNTSNVPNISEVGDCMEMVRDWTRFIL